MGNSNIRRSQF